MRLAPLVLLAIAAVGRADEITVQASRADRVQTAWQLSVARLDRPSERTAETLKRLDVERTFRRDPERALRDLEQFARERPEADVVYALAELSWIESRRAEGRRFDRRRGAAALRHYIDTVAFAYDYLFDPELAPGRRPTDPRYRLACELYNGALDRLIRAAMTQGRLQPGDTIEVMIHGSKLALKLRLDPRSPWKGGDVDELLLASDFELTGLESRSREFGIGVPLIGVRRSAQAGKGPDKYYPPETAFPLTAVLLPDQRIRDLKEGEARRCTIDLVDPIQNRAVGPEAVPLEADVTMPLAYMWSRTDLSRFRWTGLLRPGEAAGRAGLMLLRPYDPDKIPVVMVHGLASSPLAWIPMLNEMLRDPKISTRYQLLLYVYPTGVPVPIAASGLRDALLDAQRSFDIEGRTPDREFRRMVLLGHSMGGILSHAMVAESGDRFWELNTDRRFDEIGGPPKVREELGHYTFFKPLPFVRRVVFIATPHRGSDYSRRMIGRVSSSLIAEPDHFHQLLAQLIKDNPDAFDRRRFRRLPTSIETLETDAPVLLALLAMKPGPGVVFHSIIGSTHPGPIANSTDGVVPYKSSHFDGAASERVVRGGHGIQKEAGAILEVGRILLEHLAADGLADPEPARAPEVAPTADPGP